MSRDVYEQTVELLDRKFRFLMETQDTSFNLELEKFVVFLTENELVRDVANKVKQEIDEQKAAYQVELKHARERVCELKDRLLTAHPETADQEGDYYTFAEFDLLVSDHNPIVIPEFRENSLRDDSEANKLITLLCAKLTTLEDRIRHGKLSTTIDDDLANDIYGLRREQEFNFKKWFNFNKTSSGRALADLEREVSDINPHPKAANYVLIKHFNRGVGDRTYSYTEQHKYRFNEKDKARFALLREKARNVYEGVRQEIGATRLRSQLLDRYAVRCHYYHQEQLYKQVFKENRYVRPREHILTKDLALYLYDQGVTTIYRPRFGSREPDLMELDATRPMFIEAKVYTDNKAKQYLLDGVKQLHSYLSYLEPDKNIDEAYYVIFRVGGPIYEFPKIISTNRFRIYPVLVDLGQSTESGSRQKGPIIISIEEVLATISKSQKRIRRNSPKRGK